MTTISPLEDYDCSTEKPGRCRIVWLMYEDGSGAPGMWNGRQWWPSRHHGDPVLWRELQPKELRTTIEPVV